MKLLILACVLGIAAADLMRAAAPEVDRSVKAFLKGSSQAGSLSQALGVDEPWLDEVGNDVKTELGKKLKEVLNEMLEKIKDNVEHGKNVARELLEKVKGIREELKNLGIDVGTKAKELLQKIKSKAKETLRKILENLGLDKMNLDTQVDSVARSQLREVLENLKEKILANVHKIREYIRNIASDSPLALKLKELVETLKDDDLREIIRHLLGHRPSETALKGEKWDKIKNFFKDLNVKIQEHARKFGQWLREHWTKGTDKLKEKYGAIKAIALEFISNAKDASAEVAREALEFFRPYQEDLGTLWKQIVDAVKEAIGQI